MITVSDLSVSRQKPDGSLLPVLDRITLRVNPGELVAVIGPSGCGKSTLLSTIAGFIAPTSGCICADGRPVKGPGPDRIMIFQQDSLFPWLTVLGNVTYGLDHRRSANVLNGAKELLSRLGLSGFEHHLPETLSGGMRQRVELARALLHHPQILLLDEPFAALDAQTREEMQDLLLTVLNERPIPMILVTHDVTEAAYLAHRTIVLSQRPCRILTEVTSTCAQVHTPAWREDLACAALAVRLRHLLRTTLA